MQRSLPVSMMLAVLSCTFFTPAGGQEITWDEVYEPLVLRSLNVQLSDEDYATIQQDETFDIKVPAIFWADGETDGYLATIRRKSATPIGEKISYRIAIVSMIGDANVKRWHSIKSMSIENGDDQDVVSEGLAWYLHRQASTDRYQPGLAAWIKLTMHVVTPVRDDNGQPVYDENGQMQTWVDVRPQGVYVNLELPDKQFLQNRGLWVANKTWLYKQDDIGLPEIKEWPFDSNPEHHSPTYEALTYSPFRSAITQGKRVLNPPPSDTVLEQDLTAQIDMDTMLRLGAANAFAENPDELFNHAKNFHWVDYSGTGDDRRLYLPWDLDASVRNGSALIYGTASGGGKKATVVQHPYQQTILNHPTYRAQYNQIMRELLDGPLAVDPLQQFLDDAELLLTEALLDDPNNQIGNTPQAIAEHFDSLRNWVVQRHQVIRSQLADNGPPSPR